VSAWLLAPQSPSHGIVIHGSSEAYDLNLRMIKALQSKAHGRPMTKSL
jgi:hypothetical protein